MEAFISFFFIKHQPTFLNKMLVFGTSWGSLLLFPFSHSPCYFMMFLAISLCFTQPFLFHDVSGDVSVSHSPLLHGVSSNILFLTAPPVSRCFWWHIPDSHSPTCFMLFLMTSPWSTYPLLLYCNVSMIYLVHTVSWCLWWLVFKDGLHI